MDEKSTHLKDLLKVYKVYKATEGSAVANAAIGDAAEEAVARSRKRNTVTEEGDRDGLDPHHHLPQQLQNESESHNSGKKQQLELQNANYYTKSSSRAQHRKGKTMSTSRRKNPSVTAQSKLLAKTVQRNEQQQQRLSFFAVLFSDGTSSNQDLNDVYRNEMLRRKVRSSDPNLSLSIKTHDSNFGTDDQYGNNEEGNDKGEAEKNAHCTLLDTATGTEESPFPPSDSLFSGVFFRPSYVGGDEDDAVEALNNREVDESPDSKFILHLVS